MDNRVMTFQNRALTAKSNVAIRLSYLKSVLRTNLEKGTATIETGTLRSFLDRSI